MELSGKGLRCYFKKLCNTISAIDSTQQLLFFPLGQIYGASVSASQKILFNPTKSTVQFKKAIKNNILPHNENK